jgi:hypothetical protein
LSTGASMMRLIHGPLFPLLRGMSQVLYAIPDCFHSLLQRVLSGALRSWTFGRIPALLRMRTAAGFQSMGMQ